MRYRRVRELGHGMAGVVHEAIADDGRRVVVKTLAREVARSSSQVERFRREALAMARIRHPNVMPVLDVQADGPEPFYVMPLLEGTTLASALAAKTQLGGQQAVSIVRDLAFALAEIHRRGLVHRDVKPSNVFLGPSGRAILFDFGLLKDTSAANGGITEPGQILGTPAYMSPEQIRGEPVTGKSDVYALGVTAVELLVGKNPFAARDVIECCRRHAFLRPKRLDVVLPHRVGPDLGHAIDMTLEKEPSERPTALELGLRLGSVLAGVTRARDVATRAAVRPPQEPTVARTPA